MVSRTILSGAAIFDGAQLHEDKALVVGSGLVEAIVPTGETGPGERISLPGGVLAPGFIDLQVNGGGGILLNDAPNLAGIRRIVAAHGRLGTTGLLPTLITDRPEVTRAAAAAGIAAADAGVPGFLGLHLEGPHLDPRRKGAHDPALIRPMGAADLGLLLDAAKRLPVLLVTVAPESVTLEQVAALAAAGVIVSLGHSDTSAEGATRAFAAGARMATHLFNAMSQLQGREPGLVGAALGTAGVRAGLIADGIHASPLSMRLALAAREAPESIFLVTDAMAVAGTDLEGFELNGRRILRRDGRLTLADGTLAGADIDFPGAIRVLTGKVGLDLAEALALATSAPAAAIGQGDRLGRLAPGLPADFVHLDDGLRLRGTWRAGEAI